MIRPLKDIVAELDAKYGKWGLKTLEERSIAIRDYEACMEYLFQVMDSYVSEAKYTIEHNLSLSIISRITQNLIIDIVHAHKLLSSYSDAVTVYLMDERYDQNYNYWIGFTDKASEIKALIDRLNDNNVFCVEEVKEESYLIYYDVVRGFDDRVPPEVKQENELAIKTGTKLLNCLYFVLEMMEDELDTIKTKGIWLEDEIVAEFYELNYLLYATKYWPDVERNFRPHIMKYYFKDNVNISELERLRRDKVHEFEYNTSTGRIWRDCSEDTILLAKKLKEQIKTDTEWTSFFQSIFELEEYDRWIDELRNPPESEEDRQKRARLLRSNKIFNLQPANQKKGIDILLLYQFIDTRFVPEVVNNYEWYALYYVLKKNGILKVRLAEDFAKQMNNEEWFPNVNKKCSAKAIKDLEFLKKAESGQWVVDIRKKSGTRVSKKTINTIFQRYDYLTDCLDEIFIDEIPIEKGGYTIINYGTYNDIHDNKEVHI